MRIICPRKAVVPLEDSEADDVSLARSVRPLVGHQNRIPHLGKNAERSAEIPRADTAVAVHQYRQRRTLFSRIIASPQGQPVKRADLDVLVRRRHDLANQRPHPLRVDLDRRACVQHNIRVVHLAPIGIKGVSESKIRRDQRQKGGGKQKNRNRHGKGTPYA